MKRKKGSITDMKHIQWIPGGEDRANLAIVEKWYMEKCGVTDCSKVYGADILRASVREMAELIRKRKV